MIEKKVALIGKVNDSGAQRLLVAYEGQSGERQEWIPREAILRQEALPNGRTAFLLGPTETDAGDYDPSKEFSGVSVPMVNEPLDISVADALENDGPLPEEAFDDTRPLSFREAGDDDIPEILLVGGDDESITDVWGGGLLTGGRYDTVCDWDFDPLILPSFVALQEEAAGGVMMPRMRRVNDKNGNAAVFHGFNPKLRSAREPAGAHLGTYSDRYYPLAYPVVFRPILQKAAESGWQASVMAYDRGKKARLDCDVMGAVHHDGMGYGRDMSPEWSTVAESDSGWLAPETMAGLQEQVHKVWRYGFSIHNSLDGKGALKAQAVARRLACTNVGVIGGMRNLVSLRHTKGVMEPMDWDDFAGIIDSIIVSAQRGLGHVEALKNIPVEEVMFERLITLAEREGLISWPRRNEKGEMLGSHMWHLFGHGWTNPTEPWVAVGAGERRTLYHAYQVLTGAITHKPEWRTKGRILKGKTLKMGTFDSRLRKVDALLTGLGRDTMQTYAREVGGPIQPEDWSDLQAYVTEKGVIGLGDDVPTATEVLRVLSPQ